MLSRTTDAGEAILELALDIAPWLVIGLIAAGMIKGCLPRDGLTRLLGGPGRLSIFRAAVVGLPLPLCSCGAIPAAFALYRGGASRGSATAFMVSTPGIGIDSLLITHALLGPAFAAVRAAGALFCAVATGLALSLRAISPLPEGDRGEGCGCGEGCGEHPPVEMQEPAQGWRLRLVEGLRYAFVDMLRDIGPWMALGVILAGTALAWLPPDFFADTSSGPLAYFLLAMVGIPLYFCAQAATPVAVAMIAAGVSPGAALVFLLSGPVTSLATLFAFRREFGGSAMLVYLGVLVLSASLSGMAVDAFFFPDGLKAALPSDAPKGVFSGWIKGGALLLLGAAFAIATFRQVAARSVRAT